MTCKYTKPIDMPRGTHYRTDKEIQKGRFTIVNLKYIAGKVRRFDIPNQIYFQDKLLNYFAKSEKTNIQDIIELNLLPKGREFGQFNI